MLYYLEGYTQQETAQLLCINRKAVAFRLEGAIAKMK